MLHVIVSGGIYGNAEVLSVNYCAVRLLRAMAFCAVNLYALISGYVGCISKYKYSNIVYLWLKVVFYTVSITGIFYIFLPETTSFREVINAIFPVLNNQYWYFSAYFGLFFFIPLLNKAIENLSQIQLKAVIISILIITSVFSLVFQIDPFKLSNGFSTLWLAILYITGAYIKKYGILKNHSTVKLFIYYLLFSIATWFGEILTVKIPHACALVNYTSPTTIGAAVALLLIFERIKLSATAVKIIKIMSLLSFCVYIIHMNPLVVKHLLTCSFVSLAFVPTIKLVVYSLLISLGIYLACSMVDWLRESLFRLLKIKSFLEKIEQKYVGNIWND